MKKNNMNQNDPDELEMTEDLPQTTSGKHADIQDFEDSLDEEKPKKKKLPAWVIVPILLAVIGGAVGISALAGGKSNTVKTLSAAKVGQGDVKEVYTVSGTVTSEQTKTFYSPVTAPVSISNLNVGAAVKAGDLLISYDTTDLENNNTQSQLQLKSTQASNKSTVEQTANAEKTAKEAAQKAQAQAQAQIDTLSSQLAQAQSQADQLRAQANEQDSYIASYNAQIAAARAPYEAALSQAQVNLDNLTVEYNTAKSEQDNFDALHIGDSEEVKNARRIELAQIVNSFWNKQQELQNAINTNQAQLDQIGEPMAGSDLSSAIAAADQQVATLQASLEQAQNATVDTGSTTTGLTSGQKESMAISENLAELSVLTVEELVQKGRDGVKAEFDGVISDVQAATGAMVSQGTPLFTLVSNKNVSVKLEVPSSDFDKLIVGNKATVKIGQNSYQGTVTEIDKIAVTNVKGNPVIGAKVHIDNPDDNIVVGVTAKATLDVAESKNVLNVSNEVINTDADGDFVYIIENGTLVKKSVTLGISSNSTVEILSGLKKDDKVVTEVSSDLKEGMKATAVLTDK